MNTEGFGLWAMLAFWASAIGGIFLGVQWAKSRSKKSPASKEAIIISLKMRRDAGELTELEYQKKIDSL